MKKNRFILAVSGGVDSVVLLDMAMKWPEAELIVAHFDHGIRPDSESDAAFVKGLAKKYNLVFEGGRGELGAAASEEAARAARYDFLQSVARKYDARIVTAHHADDVVETGIINILRGTGWRGLSSLRSGEVYRPLLAMRKREILLYAKEKHLEWREDSTNTDQRYLRNYVRHSIVPKMGEHGGGAFRLITEAQRTLSERIDDECLAILRMYKTGENGYRRHLFIMSDEKTATELLRAALLYETNLSFERPQLARALLAVKTFLPGKQFEIGQGVTLRFSRSEVIVSKV